MIPGTEISRPQRRFGGSGALSGSVPFPGWNVWGRGTGGYLLFFFFLIYLFISRTGSSLLRGLSPVGLSRGYSSLWCVAF